MFTLIGNDGTAGLQAQVRETGEWVDVPAGPSVPRFTANLGLLACRLSRGKFNAAIHRVANPTGQERHSLPALFQLDFGETVTPVVGACAAAGAAGEGAPGVAQRDYRPITAAEVFWQFFGPPGSKGDARERLRDGTEDAVDADSRAANERVLRALTNPPPERAACALADSGGGAAPEGGLVPPSESTKNDAHVLASAAEALFYAIL